MQNRSNPFESLRIPGIVGSVCRDCKADTIFQCSSACLQIRTGQLAPDKWGFGFLLVIDGKTFSCLPGEGAGWFRSPSDALLYGLGHIRRRKEDIPQDMLFSIDRAIDRIRNVPLFDM